MSPITVQRIEPPPPREPARAIHVGRYRIPVPAEDAPARQHLDFAALVAFANLAGTTTYSTNPALLDAANAAGGAYYELYPGERARAEALG